MIPLYNVAVFCTRGAVTTLFDPKCYLNPHVFAAIDYLWSFMLSFGADDERAPNVFWFVHKRKPERLLRSWYNFLLVCVSVFACTLVLSLFLYEFNQFCVPRIAELLCEFSVLFDWVTNLVFQWILFWEARIFSNIVFYVFNVFNVSVSWKFLLFVGR